MFRMNSSSTASPARNIDNRPVSVRTFFESECDCIARRRCAKRMSHHACIHLGPFTTADSSVVTAPRLRFSSNSGAHRAIAPAPRMESPSMNTAMSFGSTP